MKFKKEDLIDFEFEEVQDEIIGISRWAVHRRKIFIHNGKFYETIYRVGSTENQKERPYEYALDEIECKEVFPKEKIITIYE